MSGTAFVKAHGTQNDFLVLPDLDASMDLTVERVRALCDRRRGVGADGILRVAPSARSGEVSDQADRAAWFMDYRNADGTAAEMCGNGARVFARYLVDHDLVDSHSFAIATRGGVREIDVLDDDVAVDMGAAVPRPDLDGALVGVGESTWPLQAVDFPNPHAVVFVDDLAEIGPLTHSPAITPESTFPWGVNVEFAIPVSEDTVRFRVFERGVGETRSCGTGACAVAWAYRRSQPHVDPATPLTVEVLGGQLRVWQREDGHWVLSGPTETVAVGELSASWWRMHR